jgi:hypothetical protein
MIGLHGGSFLGDLSVMEGRCYAWHVSVEEMLGLERITIIQYLPKR